MSTNTVHFIVFIAHEIGFGAVAHRARRRTVSQLGVVSITSKPKSQPPHLVSTNMDNTKLLEDYRRWAHWEFLEQLQLMGYDSYQEYLDEQIHEDLNDPTREY